MAYPPILFQPNCASMEQKLSASDSIFWNARFPTTFYQFVKTGEHLLDERRQPLRKLAPVGHEVTAV